MRYWWNNVYLTQRDVSTEGRTVLTCLCWDYNVSSHVAWTGSSTACLPSQRHYGLTTYVSNPQCTSGTSTYLRCTYAKSTYSRCTCVTSTCLRCTCVMSTYSLCTYVTSTFLRSESVTSTYSNQVDILTLWKRNDRLLFLTLTLTYSRSTHVTSYRVGHSVSIFTPLILCYWLAIFLFFSEALESILIFKVPQVLVIGH